MSTLFPVAILAGGLATRLRPMTEKIPKALIPIAGKPFIAHQLKLLKKNNIEKVVLCTGYLGEQIFDFVGDGSQFGMCVHYVFDGPQLLGTGGALKKALPLLGDAFFVLYGDSYLLCDYAAVQNVFTNSQKLALMTVFRNNGLWDVSNIEFRDGNILAYDKAHHTGYMEYIDYGLSVVSSLAFQTISENKPYDLADLFQLLLQQNQLAAYEVIQRFYEVGSFSGIQEFEHYVKEKES